MGIKKVFSKDPIDFQKLRKSNKKRPSKSFYRKFHVVEKEHGDTKVIVVESKKDKINDEAKGLTIFIHGGAFVSGPAPHHWDAVNKIVSVTQQTIWLVDYPKAPEYGIKQISKNIDAVYNASLQDYEANQITLIGDSAGATLIMGLVQRLVKNNGAVPAKLLLITPVFDSSMTNGEIDKINKRDPMLSKAGVLSAKKMCAQGMDLKDPMLSPMYGEFRGFPGTTVFIGGYDINYPDGVLAVEKMKQSIGDLEIIDEPQMPHIYPLLPVMPEAVRALSKIIHKVSGGGHL